MIMSLDNIPSQKASSIVEEIASTNEVFFNSALDVTVAKATSLDPLFHEKAQQVHEETVDVVVEKQNLNAVVGGNVVDQAAKQEAVEEEEVVAEEVVEEEEELVSEESIPIVQADASGETGTIFKTTLASEEAVVIKEQIQPSVDTSKQNEDKTNSNTDFPANSIPQGKPRVYVKNIDYKTTEDELEEFFAGLNVGIFHKYKTLGRAYVDFKSHDDVAEAMRTRDGELLRGRIVHIKKFVSIDSFIKKPMTDKSSLTKTKASLENKFSNENDLQESTESENVEGVQNENAETPKEFKIANLEKESKDTEIVPETTNEVQNESRVDENSEVPIENSSPSKINVVPSSNSLFIRRVRVQEEANTILSLSTIFIHRVAMKCKIQDLEEYFADYNIDEIYLYERKRPFNRNPSLLSGRYRSALVSFKPIGNDEAINIELIIKENENKRLVGARIVLRQAFESKVREVTKVANSKYSFEEKGVQLGEDKHTEEKVEK